MEELQYKKVKKELSRNLSGSVVASLLDKEKGIKTWCELVGIHKSKHISLDYFDNKTDIKLLQTLETGRDFERYIAPNKYPYTELYYKGELDPISFMKRIERDEKIKKYITIDYTIEHKEYDFITGNPDGIITDDDGKHIGIVEFKSTADIDFLNNSMDKYERQLKHYLMITGLKYGEIFIFNRMLGNYFLYSYDFTQEEADSLLDLELKLYNNIKKAKQKFNKGELPSDEDIPSSYNRDSSYFKTYYYKQEYFKEGEESISINDESNLISNYIKNYVLEKEKEKTLEASQDSIKNKILSYMLEKGINNLKEKESGKSLISYKKKLYINPSIKWQQ